MSEPAVCHHCRQGLALAAPEALGLCERCHSLVNVRRLYVVLPWRPPGWGLHLERLADRAKQRLPLFGPTNAVKRERRERADLFSLLALA